MNIGHEGETGLPRMTRVAAYGLVVDERRQILLVRISPGYTAVGQWTLPGGGLNFGEDPADGARRELEEETGLPGESSAWSSSARGHEGQSRAKAGGLSTPSRSSIECASPVATLRHEVDESTDMAAWVPLDEARTLPIVDLVQLALDHLESLEHALAD